MAKDNAQEKDQSMEEILQSIKRIIAEEGEEDKSSSSVASGISQNDSDSLVKGSDVLELNEPVAPESSRKDDVLELTEMMEEMPASAEPAPSSAATEPVPASPAAKEGRDVLANIDSLLSDETVKASSAALRALSEAQAPRYTRDETRPNLVFRSGATVEDLVMEALRPLLKDWLDANLPSMVQHLVEKEIRKLTS